MAVFATVAEDITAKAVTAQKKKERKYYIFRRYLLLNPLLYTNRGKILKSFLATQLYNMSEFH